MNKKDYDKYEEAMEFVCRMCAFEYAECDGCPVKKTWYMIEAEAAGDTYKLEE